MDMWSTAAAQFQHMVEKKEQTVLPWFPDFHYQFQTSSEGVELLP